MLVQMNEYLVLKSVNNRGHFSSFFFSRSNWARPESRKMECYQLDVEKISTIKVNNGENLQNSPSIMRR